MSWRRREKTKRKKERKKSRLSWLPSLIQSSRTRRNRSGPRIKK